MKKSLLNTVFIIIFIENFFFFCCRNVLSILPPYLSSLGATKGYIGFFMNINSLMVVLFVFLFNNMADRMDKKKLLLFGFASQLLGLFFMFVFYDNLYLLMVFQFLSSISYAIGFSVNSGLIFSILPKEKRTGGIALFGISGIISSPAGSFLGEMIIKNSHPRWLFLSAVLFNILAVIAVFFIRQDNKGESSSSIGIFHIIKRKRLLILIFLAFSLGGAWSVLATFIPNFTKERLGTANLSSYFLSFAFVAMLSRLLFSGFIDKLSRKVLIMSAFSFALSAMVFTLFLFHPYQLYGIGFLYGIAHSILYPVMNALFVDNGSDKERFTSNNAFLAFYTLGNVLISTFLGFAGDLFGTISIFIGMCLICAFCIPAAGIFINKRAPFGSAGSLNARFRAG